MEKLVGFAAKCYCMAHVRTEGNMILFTTGCKFKSQNFLRLCKSYHFLFTSRHPHFAVSRLDNSVSWGVVRMAVFIFMQYIAQNRDLKQH